MRSTWWLRSWHDSVLIDQSDATEKEQKDQLIRTIYGAALHILIWLGPSSEDSWRATSLVPRLLRAKEAQSAQSDERRYYQLGPEGWQDYGLPDIGIPRAGST